MQKRAEEVLESCSCPRRLQERRQAGRILPYPARQASCECSYLATPPLQLQQTARKHQARSTSTARPVRGVRPEPSHIATATALSRPWLISAMAASLAHRGPVLSWAMALSGFMPLVGQPAATPHLPAPSPATIRRIAVVRLCKGKKALISLSLCVSDATAFMELSPNFLHGPWQPAPS